MSAETLKVLSKDILKRQLETGEKALLAGRDQLRQLEQQLVQQEGINAYVRHLLATYTLPDSAPEPTRELEVK